DDTAIPARLLVGQGLGLGWLVLLGLGIHYWPGPVSRWLLLGVYLAGALILLAIVALLRTPRRAASARLGPRFWAWAAALLLIAGLARLPGLGYHEFHADEVVLLRQSE